MDRGEIPDGPDSGGQQRVAALLGMLCGDGQNSDVGVGPAAERGQPLHGENELAVALLPLLAAGDIEAGQNIQAVIRKAVIVEDRLSQSTTLFMSS